MVVERRHDGAVLVHGDDQSGADGSGRHQRRQRLAQNADMALQLQLVPADRVGYAHVQDAVDEDQWEQSTRRHQVKHQQGHDEPFRSSGEVNLGWVFVSFWVGMN